MLRARASSRALHKLSHVITDAKSIAIHSAHKAFHTVNYFSAHTSASDNMPSDNRTAYKQKLRKLQHTAESGQICNKGFRRFIFKMYVHARVYEVQV